jgi:hypothetical protein
MSGDSPREEKCVVRNCGSNVVWRWQFNACGVIATAPAMVPAQASRQQLIV